jgi:capsular exopolysaccharide synthesis family protein
LPAGGVAPGRLRSRRGDLKLQAFEESVDGLKASLLFSDEFGGAKVLAVLSAAPGEGKTSAAAQLAISIARATGKPTLLIDGDMRSPAVHEVFDVCLGPGLAQVLAGETAFEEAVVPDATGRVDVLPAGTLEENPHRLFGSGAWSSLLQEVSARYEHIILDTPPVLAAGESLAMAKTADACVMCAMWGTSRIDQVVKARKRLQAVGARVAGIVLNGVSTRQYPFHYGSRASARLVPPEAEVLGAGARESAHGECPRRTLCGR